MTGGTILATRDSPTDGMSNESLAADIKQGRDPDGKLMLRLLSQTEAFAFWLSRGVLKNGLLEHDEIKSLHFIAVSKAVRYYKPQEGNTFFTALKYTFLRELIVAVGNESCCPLPYNLREDVRRYHRAIVDSINNRGLEPEQQQIIRGRYWEHRTVRQLAEEQGIPVGTIQKRNQKALRTLRKNSNRLRGFIDEFNVFGGTGYQEYFILEQERREKSRRKELK